MTEKQVLKRQGMDLSKLNISSLAHLCRQATDRYFQHEAYDDSFCLELFRRAITEKDETAWTVIIGQYENLVLSWVQRHHSYPITDENAEYFVNRAFDSFWSAFSRNPHKFSKFESLKALLQYLKLCSHSAVQAHVERSMPPRHIIHSEIPTEALAEPIDSISSVDDSMVAGIVWQYVLAALNTNQERVIAEEFLLYDMKPQRIFDGHNDLFTSVDQVRRVKGNLMTRLRRNRQLMAIVNGSD